MPMPISRTSVRSGPQGAFLFRNPCATRPPPGRALIASIVLDRRPARIFPRLDARGRADRDVESRPAGRQAATGRGLACSRAVAVHFLLSSPADPPRPDRRLPLQRDEAAATAGP